jgi:hypothetical protein
LEVERLNKFLNFGADTMQTNTPQAEAASVMNRNAWITGFTPQAELWNGRLAMIGFISAIAIELFTHRGVLHFWGILASGVVPVS